MPSKVPKSEQKIVNKIYSTLLLIAAVGLLTVSGLAYWGGSFALNMVESELKAQNIFFPPAGSPALDPEEYPDLQKYAGQQVDNGEKARAYANGYIGRHLAETADGKTYAEVSTEARNNPDNAELQAARQSLFMGETLRGILLGTAYAYGTLGKIAMVASIVTGVLGLGSLLGFAVLRKRA